jgi:hypothetical protein
MISTLIFNRQINQYNALKISQVKPRPPQSAIQTERVFLSSDLALEGLYSSNPNTNPVLTREEKFFPQEIYQIEQELFAKKSSSGSSIDNYVQKVADLLRQVPNSPRLLFLSAHLLEQSLKSDTQTDKSSQKVRQVQRQCVKIYKRIFRISQIEDYTDSIDSRLLFLSGLRLMAHFRANQKWTECIHVAVELLESDRLYSENIFLMSQLGLDYMSVQRPKLAKRLFERVLFYTAHPSQPYNTVQRNEQTIATCHLALILKLYQNRIENKTLNLFTECFHGYSNSSDQTMFDDYRFYVHYGDILNRLNQSKDARQVYKLAVQRGLFISEYQRSIDNRLSLASKPVWNIQDLEPTKAPLMRLQTEWEKIRDEVDKLIQFDEKKRKSNKTSGKFYFQPDEEDIELWKETTSGDSWQWRQFSLNEKSCSRVPIACQLINKMESIRRNCSHCRAKFSVLTLDLDKYRNNSDKFHVWPHCGPTNTKLRLHLTLKSLRNSCKLVIGENKQELKWKVGELLVMDDSFENEIRCDNDSLDGDQSGAIVVLVLLIVDFWHPGH